MHIPQKSFVCLTVNKVLALGMCDSHNLQSLGGFCGDCIFMQCYRVLEEVDLLPEYYFGASVELFGFSFRTSMALVNPCTLFMIFRYIHCCAVYVLYCGLFVLLAQIYHIRGTFGKH